MFSGQPENAHENVSGRGDGSQLRFCCPYAWYSAPMESCIFCRIVAGTLPASVIFSDAAVMAFMDIQPVTEGHTLLIPLAHRPNVAD